MKQFTFIFRQGRRFLSPEELKQRAGEVRAWALAQAGEGRKLDPHIMSDDGCQVTPGGDAAPIPPVSEGSVVAIVFLEATDLNGAVAIAKTHPGPRYGGNIEVREWFPPPVLPISGSQKQ